MSERRRVWARTALRLMDEPGWSVRDEDRHRNGGVMGARAALWAVVRCGREPYYTLKVFVHLNGLEEDC